jgi:hypothetical protein
MKSKSPFSRKTPLNEIEIFEGKRSTYRHPATVVQPIVGADIGKKLSEVGSKVAVDAIKSKSGKKQEFKVPELEKPEIKLKKFDYDLRSFGGKQTRKVEANRTFLKDLSEKDRVAAKEWIEKNPEKHKELLAKKKASGVNQFRTYSFDDKGNKTNFTPWRNSPNIMKGSPTKQVDPYAAVNPEAVPASQSQNVLGAQPIVGADVNQARNVDMQAMIDPYKSPGATFKPGEKINAENIYGSALQRQGLMNLGSPAHLDDKKYKKGDLIDESDFGKLETGYNVQNISRIQEDKKGQFMTTLGDRETFIGSSSKTIDYPRPGTARDTIRPKRGKSFKRGY